LISGDKRKIEEKRFNTEISQRGRREEGKEERENQREGRGKTRRLRLPVMTTARERPSGEMAKSRKLRP
jgi:hypothetical protein